MMLATQGCGSEWGLPRSYRQLLRLDNYIDSFVMTKIKRASR
jgi:hypothetical protein